MLESSDGVFCVWRDVVGRVVSRESRRGHTNRGTSREGADASLTCSAGQTGSFPGGGESSMRAPGSPGSKC